MLRIRASLLLTALLPLQALAAPLGAVECRALRERRNRLATEAMQAEIALVQATRRRLCPQLEAQAERAHAEAGTPDPQGAQADPMEQEDPVGQPGPGAQAEGAAFDYTAYLECRRRAEEQLRGSRAILYTNQRGFTFYTVEGARLAREADAWQQRLSASCGSAGAN